MINQSYNTGRTMINKSAKKEEPSQQPNNQ